MDKTFDEAIAGIRKAERGVEVREDIAQGMEYVAKISEACEKQAALATSSADTARSAARTSTAKADEATRQAKQAKADREKAQAAASTAASDVAALLNGYTDSALASKEAAAASQTAAKASETESSKNLQGTKEYFEQVRTITIGAQGWYATPEALKTAVPVGENGWWAVVGTTDTIWTWDGDTSAWVDTRKEVDLSDYLTQDQIRKLLEQYMPLRPATTTTLGGVKVGSGLSVAADGTLSADAQEYTLPIATATTLGGVKLSNDFTADADGTLHLAGGTAPDPYPVGSIFQTVSRTSPAALFGGTWQEIAQNRVLMGASYAHAAGTTVEAGLPNITGSFVANVHYRSNEVSGAFTAGDRITSTGANNGDANVYKFSLDASKSNAIYGRSSTVQPAAYYVHIWRRVA